MSERVHVMPRGGGLLEFYSIGIILKLGCIMTKCMMIGCRREV